MGRYHLVDHRVHEVGGTVLAGAQFAGVVGVFGQVAVRGQAQDELEVAEALDERDDLDAAGGGLFDELADLLHGPGVAVDGSAAAAVGEHVLVFEDDGVVAPVGEVIEQGEVTVEAVVLPLEVEVEGAEERAASVFGTVHAPEHQFWFPIPDDAALTRQVNRAGYHLP